MSVGLWKGVDEGVRRKVHQPGENLMMMEVEFKRNAVSAEHRHSHEQFTYCLKGKFEFKLEDKIITLTAGESLPIPQNALHGVKALEDGALLDIFTPIREDLLS